jgi:hypothetical protein
LGDNSPPAPLFRKRGVTPENELVYKEELPGENSLVENFFEKIKGI